jgi:hypothetical protein
VSEAAEAAREDDRPFVMLKEAVEKSAIHKSAMNKSQSKQSVSENIPSVAASESSCRPAYNSRRSSTLRSAHTICITRV